MTASTARLSPGFSLLSNRANMRGQGDDTRRRTPMTAAATKRVEQSAIRQARMLINGQWVAAASGETLTVQNPANRQPIAEIPRGRAEDVERAEKAAEAAYSAWSRVAPRGGGTEVRQI